MKISFVIPAHNEESYIGKCLSSILNCLKKEPCKAEIIVIVNASSDKTEQIAKSFSGVKVINESRKGLSLARHIGYLESRGELIANVDADTMLAPGWISRVLKEFSEDGKLVALSGPMVFYDLSGTIMKLSVRLFYCFGFVCYLFNRYVFRTASLLQGGNFVVKRSALDKIGGYNLKYSFGEDADLSRRLHKIGKVKFTFKLPMPASGRRLAREGAFTMALRYGLQYFWTVLFKKPFTQYFPDVRFEQNVSDRPLKYRPTNKTREWLIASVFAIVLLAFLVGIGFAGHYMLQANIINTISVE